MKPDRAGWRRLAAGLAVAVVGIVVITVFVPEGRLACPEGLQDHSPDGAWTLSLCPRPMAIAMPGQSGDAPAWIVLRDVGGLIRGVSALDMVQNYGASGTPPIWDRRQVTIPLTVELPLPPARGRLQAWLEDRMWRLRALTGMTPRSEDFR